MDKKNDMIELTLDQMDKVTGGTGLSDLSQHMIDNVSEKRMNYIIGLTQDPPSAPELPASTIKDIAAANAAVNANKNAVLSRAGQEMLAQANIKSSELLSLLQ